MTPGRAGALVLGVACLVPAGSAHAQNAAALARAAARSADAFDSLVTPEALRALRRMTDSAAAERVETTPPPRVRSAPVQTRASTTAPPPARTEAVAEEKPAEAAPTPAPDTARAITAIAARRAEGAVELRIVAGGQPPALSEPFRAGGRSRLFLTFPDATLALAESPAFAEAGALFAGVDIAERDGGVRIAVDLMTLDRYALRAAGDTAILWLAQPAPAAEVPHPVAPASAPDDIALAREAARAGWAAFRADVATVAHAFAGVTVRAAAATRGGAAGAWNASSRTAARATRWVSAALPFAAITRVIALIALLLAPPLVALRLLRRRQASAVRPRAAEIVGLAAETARPKPEPQPKQPKQAKQMNEAKPPKHAKQPKGKKPAVTRTTADARLWAARTLAANGADVAEIARQTGLSREAAILLVRRQAVPQRTAVTQRTMEPRRNQRRDGGRDESGEVNRAR